MHVLDGTGDLMAVYGVSFYSVGQFGPDPATVRPDFSVAPFTSMPLSYSSLYLKWNTPPSTDCAYLRLVRNPRNLPMDENDGFQVFDLSEFADNPPAAPSNVFGDPKDSIVVDAMQHITDLYLPQGFQYYTMFGWSLSENMWVRCTDLIALVPLNWGYGARLYNLLPMAYRDMDVVLVDQYNPWPVDGPTPPLQRYLQLIGFQFDFIRTELESLSSINDPLNCAGSLLPLFMQEFGLVHEPEMGMYQERLLVENAVHLYKLKGSPQGITEFVTTLSSYPSTQIAHHGYNELLVRDDGVMATSVGTWQTWPPTGTNFPAISNNTGVVLTQIPTLTAAPYNTTNPLETFTAFPTFQQPYTNSGMQVLSGNAVTGDSASFSGGTVGNWRAGANTTISFASGQVMQMHAVAAGNMTATLYNVTAVTAGQTYNFSGQFQAATTGRAVSIAVQWLNASGGVISTSTAAATDTTASLVTASATNVVAPAGAVNVNLVLTVTAAAANENHYVDYIVFQPYTQDIYLTTAGIPITDFMSQYYGPGHATFTIQIWSSVSRQVRLSLWGDAGTGTPFQIVSESIFTETAGHWTVMTLQGVVNPYPGPVAAAPPEPPPGVTVPTGAASYYWIYPRVRISGVAANEAHYITICALWPCIPSKVGVDTPVYDYPRDVKVLIQPTASNLLPNTLTSFSRINPANPPPNLQPPPNWMLIGLDGLTNATDPTQPTTNPTCTLVYRPEAVEDPTALVPVYGNAALQVNATSPGATVWFGTVSSWSSPPPTPLGWFSSVTPGSWFSGATQGPLPRPWFDPVYSWFIMNQQWFGVGSSWVNGVWFPQPAQPAMNGNLQPFQVQAGMPFNFSVYAQYMTVMDPSNALMQMGFRWYYPDGTWKEVTTNAQITDQYQRYSIAPSGGDFSLGEPPLEVSPGLPPIGTGISPTTMYPFIRFPYAQQARFLLNAAMLEPADPTVTLPQPYMDATSQSQTTGDFVVDPASNASYEYPRRTPRIARLNMEMYRWLPMGSTYSITYASGAVTPPLDPTLWP